MLDAIPRVLLVLSLGLGLGCARGYVLTPRASDAAPADRTPQDAKADAGGSGGNGGGGGGAPGSGGGGGSGGSGAGGGGLGGSSGAAGDARGPSDASGFGSCGTGACTSGDTCKNELAGYCLAECDCTGGTWSCGGCKESGDGGAASDA